MSYTAELRKTYVEVRRRLTAPPVKAPPIVPPPVAMPVPEITPEPVAPEPVAQPHRGKFRFTCAIVRTGDQPSSSLRIGYIIEVVAQHYGVSTTDILSERRTADVLRPRQVAVYLARTLTLRSMPFIGQQFGGRDHTTILSSARKISRLLTTDSDLAATVELLKQRILEGDE